MAAQKDNAQKEDAIWQATKDIKLLRKRVEHLEEENKAMNRHIDSMSRIGTEKSAQIEGIIQMLEARNKPRRTFFEWLFHVLRHEK